MEKILVGLKRVVDYNVRVRVKSDGTGVDTDGVKMSINPFDEIALEEALQIKERGDAEEVVVVSIGSVPVSPWVRTVQFSWRRPNRSIRLRVHAYSSILLTERILSSYCWASRPSTTTIARRVRCSLHSGTDRRRPLLRNLS